MLPAEVEKAVQKEPFSYQPQLLLALRFQYKAFLQMQRMAERDGFKFVVIYLATPQAFDETFDELYSDYCKLQHIPYVSLRDFYRRREAQGVQLFLKHDGHFDETGARETAEELVRLFPQLMTSSPD